jgi:pimeloyl-ACP methyl ester carboxylesterase
MMNIIRLPAWVVAEAFTMTDAIVLLHGGATGSSSRNAVARSLVSSGAHVFAPDMLGYGASPPPTGSYAIAEEVAHMTRLLSPDNEGETHGQA